MNWHSGLAKQAILVLVLSLATVVTVQTDDTLIRTALTGQAFNHFQEVGKDCDAGCTEYGNCNRELGQCECPYGYSGPRCEKAWLPACRTTLRPGAPIAVGRAVPRNCFCYQQLLRASCPAGLDGRCAAHVLSTWSTVQCFEQVNVPEEMQLSDLPERLDDPAYRWRRGVLHLRRQEGRAHEVEVREMEPLPAPPNDTYAVPLSKCPSRCNDQGVCRLYSPTMGPQCTCHAGFKGPDCGQATSSPLCPNNCGGRGKCVNGFCKCEPPYWGLGCARGKAYMPASGSVDYPHYPGLKIYMYDIPSDVVAPQPFDDGDAEVFVIYQAFMHFMDMFLRDNSGVRTENPYEANLFYIPTFAFYATSNLGDPNGAVVRAVDWVRHKFPFFDRNRGRDHFTILTADRGACYLWQLPQTQNLIRLVHFGLEQPNITHMRPLVDNMEYGCFKSGRDVVMAPFFRPKPEVVTKLRTQVLPPGGAEALLAKKDVLFFFSGDIRPHEPEYSGGVRQALSALLENASYPDVVFKAGFMPISSAEYEGLLSRSKFCMAPYGHGWGIRLSHAVMHACVPVIVQDRVRQPYEDLLHYPDFSVRIPKADLPQLVDILRAVPDAEVARLMRENARVHRAFVWQTEQQGLAYQYTIASLRRRLSHVRGQLYEAGTRRR